MSVCLGGEGEGEGFTGKLRESERLLLFQSVSDFGGWREKGRGG